MANKKFQESKKAMGGVKMGDAGLRNTNARWYGMIKVVEIGPKYIEMVWGVKASSWGGGIGDVE